MRSRLALLAAATLAAAISFPLGVIASHQFSDVPNSNTFHADIDAIADVGVTTGCGPSLYCPKEFVTREQMAAFLNRLGALGPGKTPVVNATRLDGLNSTQFARNDVSRNGQETCAGSSMSPTDSAYAYGTTENSIYAKSGTSHFRCQVHLPDGATITAFTEAIADNSTTENAQCALDRHQRWTTTGGHIATAPMTSVPGVGMNTLNAPSISQPIVDNRVYVYTTVCSIYGFGADVAIVAATVHFTVTGVPLE